MHIFSVSGVPAPKPVGPRTKKSSPGWQRYNAHKLAIQYAAKPVFLSPYEVPMELAVRFYLPMPKTHRHHKPSLIKAAGGLLLPTGKPDLKNLIAAVEDSLTGIAWADDAQVVAYGYAVKRYSAEGQPRTLIMVRPLAFGLEGPDADRMRKLYTGPSVAAGHNVDKMRSA